MKTAKAVYTRQLREHFHAVIHSPRACMTKATFSNATSSETGSSMQALISGSIYHQMIEGTQAPAVSRTMAGVQPAVTGPIQLMRQHSRYG